jgi:predicted nucleic-acid-binding protein
VSRAIDTNVLVRWITRDDPVQATLADTVFANETYVPLTVLIETAWVLKGRGYALDRSAIADVLERVLATESVLLDHEAGVRWAIGRYRDGADFADMVHLVSASGLDRFITFDRQLARQAGEAPPLPVETLA